MASQMNPIIAAFLQARSQAEDTFRGMQQQQLMQQRLQIEQEAQEAENEYQRLNLERLISESQQKAKEFTVTSKQNELRNKFQALGTVSNVLDKNLMSVSGVSKLIKESGLPEEVANELISAAERQAQEREAKIAEAKALMPVKVEEAGKVAGAQAEARLPSQLELEETRSTNRANLQKQREEAQTKLEKYKQGQANARSAARTSASVIDSTTKQILTSHDNHNLAKRASEVAANYNAITQIPDVHNNPNFDIDLIIYAVKTSDPDVSVRQVEADTVRKYSAGMPENIRSQIERTFSSAGATSLTPQARRHIKAAAANSAMANFRVYLPYHDTVAERLSLHKKTTKNDPELQRALGTGFIPDVIKKVDDTYYWIEPGKKPIPLYKEK